MKANRDIEQLSEPFESFVKAFLEECKQNGLDIFVTEGHRPQERQDWLYAAGRTRQGSIVTWTLNSKHTQRQAIDIAFNGSELYPRDIELWEKVYDIAEKHHILSLYRKYGVDMPHLEWSGTVPYEQTQEFLNYKNTMNEEQKQLVQSAIYVCKNMYNFGNVVMQELAKKHADELRELIKD